MSTDKRKEYYRKYNELHRDKKKSYFKEKARTVKWRYAEFLRMLKRRSRDISNELTLEDYEKIIKDDCYYCKYKLGVPVVTGSGLDRLDNNIGYTTTNSVSCCEICNKIKNNFLTSEETLAAVKAILAVRYSKQ